MATCEAATHVQQGAGPDAPSHGAPVSTCVRPQRPIVRLTATGCHRTSLEEHAHEGARRTYNRPRCRPPRYALRRRDPASGKGVSNRLALNIIRAEDGRSASVQGSAEGAWL